MTSGTAEQGAERSGLLKGERFRAAARTDRGPVRQRNEDAYLCRPDLGLFAVIDGMGGQQGGETAAAVTREALLASSDLVLAFTEANRRIQELSRSAPELGGMGCVASAVRVTEDGADVVHVGDTRIYLASRAGCEQLTRDHTVAARRQEQLGLTDRRARGMKGHNQVTRDIGGRRQDDNGWMDRLEVTLDEGDLLLLCSDGVHGALPRSELMALLRGAWREGTAPEKLVEKLVELALARGTRDNATAVVAVRTSADEGGLAAWLRRMGL